MIVQMVHHLEGCEQSRKQRHSLVLQLRFRVGIISNYTYIYIYI